MTNYENLQPLWRLENHELCHISSLVRQPEIESGEICSFQPALLVGRSGSPLWGERRHFQSLPETVWIVN
jgi:hypothetical protein